MQKRIFYCALLASAQIALADVPEVIITTLSSSGGHATVAGRLASKPERPVGISVRNGNLMYSTLTDAEGRWGIVIRHLAVNVSVESWSLLNSGEKSATVTKRIENDITAESGARLLPWTEYASASGSSSSESSAKYQAETSLRYQIDRLRYRCEGDKGRFSYYSSQMTCHKSGMTYSCNASATCQCGKP